FSPRVAPRLRLFSQYGAREIPGSGNRRYRTSGRVFGRAASAASLHARANFGQARFATRGEFRARPPTSNRGILPYVPRVESGRLHPLLAQPSGKFRYASIDLTH